MPLKGKAKTDYQRDYMRKRRSNTGKPLDPEFIVRPSMVMVKPEYMEGITTTTPIIDASGEIIPEYW